MPDEVLVWGANASHGTMVKKQKQQFLQIIPLGGQGEVGKNMLLLQYKRKILIVDFGLRFPEENMPGVDYIIPNISYLKGKEKQILGIVITHAHFDHIGAIPYLINELGNPKIFASKLAKGIILKRQTDFSKQPKLEIETVKSKDRLNLGPFKIEFFKQNHNIPETLGLFINTPLGNILHTSDFKFDSDPVFDTPTDFNRLKALASRKIHLLCCDSTRAEAEGYSLSERKIIENLDKIFKDARGRIIVATFSSLINRIQQIIFLSEKYNREVVLEGYSMKSNVEIAKNLNYIKAKKGTFINAKKTKDFPDSKITVLCTGAQGEEKAALMRIANREHKYLRFKSGDTVIFSSSVIPGNERAVQLLKDDILRRGAKVIHYELVDIHAGGHAKKEELRKMINIMNPRFFMPVHGQYSMLMSNAQIAKEVGLQEKNIVVAENGDIINLESRRIYLSDKKAPSDIVMIDGLGLRNVEQIVLRDRRNLAEDGMFVIVVVVNRQTGKVRGSPDIISRGFVYLREQKELLHETRKKAISIVNKASGQGKCFNWAYIKDRLRDQIGEFLYKKTQRRPMVLPVVIEV